MTEKLWLPYDNGKAVGQKSSDGGTVIVSEVAGDEARITLYRGSYMAPYTIICGLDKGFHTAFADTEEEANEKYAAMKADIMAFLLGNQDAIDDFTDRY